MYLKVEVKACRSWVTICHTLQSHIVSFDKRVLSNDLKDDVLCRVCADNRQIESQRGDVFEGRECIKWSVCPQQLAAGTAEADCQYATESSNFSIGYDQLQKSRRWANCSHIPRHSTKQSFQSLNVSVPSETNSLKFLVRKKKEEEEKATLSR